MEKTKEYAKRTLKEVGELLSSNRGSDDFKEANATYSMALLSYNIGNYDTAIRWAKTTENIIKGEYADE